MPSVMREDSPRSIASRLSVTPALASANSGDDHVARPRLPDGLESFVRRHGEAHAGARGPCVLRCRLLAERAPQRPGPLEGLARRRVRRREQAHCDTGDRRMDSRLEQCDPERQRDDEVGRAVPDAGSSHEDGDDVQRDRDRQRGEREVVGVRHGDDQERGDVVDDDERQQEDAQPRRAVAADESEDAEGERGVGPDRDAPALRAGCAAVEREVDQRRRDDAADRGDDRCREPAAFAQLAHVELAPDLQADDEEEERHQPVVDPVAQLQGDAGVAEANCDLGRPELFVGRRPRRVGPEQRQDRRGHEDDRACVLRREERPKRCRGATADRLPSVLRLAGSGRVDPRVALTPNGRARRGRRRGGTVSFVRHGADVTFRRAPAKPRPETSSGSTEVLPEQPSELSPQGPGAMTLRLSTVSAGSAPVHDPET